MEFTDSIMQFFCALKWLGMRLMAWPAGMGLRPPYYLELQVGLMVGVDELVARTDLTTVEVVQIADLGREGYVAIEFVLQGGGGA